MNKPIFATAIVLSMMAGLLEAGEPAIGQKIVTAAQVNGVWESKQGEFKILALGQQKLRVEFNGTYNTGTTVNIGEAKGTANIEGATAVFKPDDTKSCIITLKFNGKAMQVAQDGDWNCGFGMNVDASGTYKKIKAGKPTFAE